ncbi:hypothetical protein [Kibdelosporangium phytohabitans]|uniref:hypothetical protein n=1 Tax=Kibdelosporangium phytohabitans TaxID=860235 RepID=UPI0012F87C82|nr:hypothetical protein [Kibdelosporangium phytohabitans]MBE1470300.1 hypothetical protein [Kibdelosporangium phytohabitans]
MDTLTTAQHDRLLNLVRRSPAFIGMRVVVHDDLVRVVDPHELEIGLGPVFDAVTGVPVDQWADLVDDRLNRIVGALVNGESELDGPVEHVIDRIYARLRPAEGSPVEWWTYAPEIAPGLLMVLALDHSDRVAILNDDQVRRYGYDQLIQAGLDNLCGQLPETYAISADVYVLTGGDYVGSAVLVMPWVVEAVTGDREYPDGVLVAMPNHGTLLFHVLREGAAARYAMGEIARVAAGFHADDSGPGQLSPYVYWLPSGAGYLEPVAHFDGDANGVIGEDVTTHYSADFAAVLNGLR